MFGRRDRLQIKTPEQIQLMRRAGLVVGETLALCASAPAPGMTTGELDAHRRGVHPRPGGMPSFLGYHGFPGRSARRVNDEVVHGIPGDARAGRRRPGLDRLRRDRRRLARRRGRHRRGRRQVAPPEPTGADRATEDVACGPGIAALRVGGRLYDIGAAVEDVVAAAPAARYGIVEDYVGHGIGTEMHMDPQVPNYRVPGRGPRLVRGWPWRSSRWSPSAAPRPGCWTTAGPWSPPTAAGRPTWSTRSPSPRTGPGCSPPWTAGSQRLGALARRRRPPVA